LKELRKLKKVSQADVDTDLLEKTGFTHNVGRNEVEGNLLWKHFTSTVHSLISRLLISLEKLKM
jgi:hypothetical protein